MIAPGVPVALLLVAIAVVVWPTAPDRVGSVDRSSAEASPDQPSAGGRRGGRALPVGLQSALVVGSTVLVAIELLGPGAGLLAACAISPAVLAALAWLRRRPEAVRPDRALALCLDLVAAVLRTGQPVGRALSAAAPIAGPAAEPRLHRVARLLELGADPAEAWQACAGPGQCDAVVAVAVRSHSSGIRLADAFERLAGELRDECEAHALAQANRAGVRAMGPLAACFLPSFLCLGIVPVIVGIATRVIGTVRSLAVRRPRPQGRGPVHRRRCPRPPSGRSQLGWGA